MGALLSAFLDKELEVKAVRFCEWPEFVALVPSLKRITLIKRRGQIGEDVNRKKNDTWTLRTLAAGPPKRLDFDPRDLTDMPNTWPFSLLAYEHL